MLGAQAGLGDDAAEFQFARFGQRDRCFVGYRGAGGGLAHRASRFGRGSDGLGRSSVIADANLSHSDIQDVSRFFTGHDPPAAPCGPGVSGVQCSQFLHMRIIVMLDPAKGVVR